jgi:hypothetical protein
MTARGDHERCRVGGERGLDGASDGAPGTRTSPADVAIAWASVTCAYRSRKMRTTAHGVGSDVVRQRSTTGKAAPGASVAVSAAMRAAAPAWRCSAAEVEARVVSRQARA